MRNLIPIALLIALALSACSGQGSFTFDVKANTPTPSTVKTAAPAAVNTPTGSAQTEEQPPSPGGQETTADKLPPDIVILIQEQLAGQTIANPPRVFIIHQSVTLVEPQYTLQLSARGWQTVSSSSGLTGKAKVMVLQKGKVKAHVIFVTQSNAETVVYVLTTKT